MKKICYTLLLLLFFLFSCNKRNNLNLDVNTSADSLSTYFSLANDFNLPQSKREEFNQKAFAIVVSQTNDSVNRVNLFKVANRYFNMDNLESYKETVKLVLEKSESTKDTTNILKAFIYLGDYYGSQGVSDTAFIYYFKAEKIYLKHHDAYNVAKTRLNKALLKYNESDFLGSEIAVFNALRVVKGEKASDIVYDSYNMFLVAVCQIIEFH